MKVSADLSLTFSYTNVSRQVKIQLLINGIRKMILRFINNIQNRILTTYHIVIDFQTKEDKPTFYRLELLVELRNNIEFGNLQTQLHGQLAGKFEGYKTYTNEIKTQYDKQKIINNFNDSLKKHISMNFIFRQWVRTFQETDPIGYKTIRVYDDLISPNGVKDYRVNILKSGQIGFSTIRDMFCVEIDTTEFKDENPTG